MEYVKPQFRRIVCKDGETLSVQASELHYSTPRQNKGPYSEVEVGYPSVQPPETWKEFCEDWDKPTQTVYGYIPVNLVEEFIQAHGGIDISKTL